MSSKVHISNLALVFTLALLLRTGHGDIGTATMGGSPPYDANACGMNLSQLPSDGLLALAGEGIWDNGAACGRTYSVKCTSAAPPGACRSEIIKVPIVGRASTSETLKIGTTLVLSGTAFLKIATNVTKLINLEFIQI